jgi:hypothetical protein
MEDYREYYQQWKPSTDIEITCYDQLSIEEIILHTIYTEFYYPKVGYLKHSKEDRYIINEAIGRYCRIHDINTEHIFTINLCGDLVPRRIREGRMNIDQIVNSRDGTLAEWEIKDSIAEIRNELNKRKAEAEYDFKWIGEWK